MSAGNKARNRSLPLDIFPYRFKASEPHSGHVIALFEFFETPNLQHLFFVYYNGSLFIVTIREVQVRILLWEFPFFYKM